MWKQGFVLFVERSTNLTCLQMVRFQISFSVCAATKGPLATSKHELWECPGNNLISHSHIQKSDHLVKLAQ